jgi:hypothetical protein
MQTFCEFSAGSEACPALVATRPMGRFRRLHRSIFFVRCTAVRTDNFRIVVGHLFEERV